MGRIGDIAFVAAAGIATFAGLAQLPPQPARLAFEVASSWPDSDHYNIKAQAEHPSNVDHSVAPTTWIKN
ncbi:MAG TPA: hypothetical protein VGG97_16335 [Bryobacteraceae bacterium]|jgi:hypothetical protein